MPLTTIIFIALGLSMDAFAVSVASGFTFKALRFRHSFRIALAFGLFQAVMPIIGWFAGIEFRHFISGFDHWIAFALLGIIGGKMIYESGKIEQAEKTMDPSKLSILILLAIATSIDALVVGLTLSFLKIAILTPALIIGAITFCLSFIGIYIGKSFGHFFEKYIELAGGLILIGMGVKILIEHLTA